MPSAAPPRIRQRWLKAHDAFGQRMREAMRVGESTDDPEPRTVDERLVQCIWHDQLLKSGELRTASGKRVEIVEPGRWNTTGRGPDFQDARIRLAGSEISGDIEIHIVSSGWTQHGHHQDFEYNNVVLHVVLRAADDRPYEEKQNGERLERLILEPVLDPDLETIRRTLNVDDYPYGKPADTGLCHERFLSLPEDRLRVFFDTAGRARIDDKVRRFRAQSGSASVPQLIYQSLMVGQGYKSSKTLYFLLSKRAPVSEIFDYANDVKPEERADLFLSILLHVAQLYPTQPDLFDGADAETRAYAERLQNLWRPVRGFFTDRLMPPTKRWYSGMRPPGFPPRRLTAVSILLTRLANREEPLFDVFRTKLIHGQPGNDQPKLWRAFYRDLAQMLVVEDESHYFARHYTLGGKECRPQALLGEPAAQSLVFNVMLPLVLLNAEGEDEAAVWRAAERFPALPKNSVTKFMTRRLFAETGLEKAYFRTELMQQALFKIFSDCCAHNERTCTDCTFLNPPFRPPE